MLFVQIFQSFFFIEIKKYVKFLIRYADDRSVFQAASIAVG